MAVMTGPAPQVPWADALAGAGLAPVLQPLVDLDTGVALAHESLLRGAPGGGWEMPADLLAAARRDHVRAELDAASIRATVAAAVLRMPSRSTTVLVNVEPDTLRDGLDGVLAAIATRPPWLQLVVEITERARSVDPGRLLVAVERLRAAGCAIALDDVGTGSDALALLPLLQPEVVKLDLRLLRTADDPATVSTAHAVAAYAEQTGAVVVAEGVETDEDRARALVLGATLGQGWLWGRPGPVPAEVRAQPRRFRARRTSPGRTTSLLSLLGADSRPRRVPARLLRPISRTLEEAAAQMRTPPVLLACFPDAETFSAMTAGRYRRLGTRLPLVGVLGRDMPPEPVPGVRGGALEAEDPVAQEWAVVVLGAHEAAAVVARACGARDARGEALYDFVVTHDRERVSTVARAMVRRLAPPVPVR